MRALQPRRVGWILILGCTPDDHCHSRALISPCPLHAGGQWTPCTLHCLLHCWQHHRRLPWLRPHAALDPCNCTLSWTLPHWQLVFFFSTSAELQGLGCGRVCKVYSIHERDGAEVHKKGRKAFKNLLHRLHRRLCKSTSIGCCYSKDFRCVKFQ